MSCVQFLLENIVNSRLFSSHSARGNVMAPRIIVCSSEQHIIRAISLKFTRAGFDVKGATDVESCWRLLHRIEPPTLLILDSPIPSVPNGLELVRWINEDVQLADLPIIMLTAESMDLDEQEDLKTTYGIDQIVDKPFSLRQLMASVNRLLSHESDEGPGLYGNNNRRVPVEAV
jgi:DNA-binding response OmpR family regulator